MVESNFARSTMQSPITLIKSWNLGTVYNLNCPHDPNLYSYVGVLVCIAVAATLLRAPYIRDAHSRPLGSKRAEIDRHLRVAAPLAIESDTLVEVVGGVALAPSVDRSQLN